MKHCTKCGELKPLSAFSKHRLLKDGHAYQCRECNKKRSKIFRASPSGIYTTFKGNALHFKKKPIKITREEFLKWYDKQTKKCAYCDIHESDLVKITDKVNNNCSRLTVDCMDNDGGYILGNIVLSCRRCNYIKQDFFSFEQMREIAQKYVKPRWKEQVKSEEK